MDLSANASPLRAYRYELQLHTPLVIGGHRLLKRQGVLIERNGSWGEAAPLAGYSHDTFQDVVQSCQTGFLSPPPSLEFALACSRQPWAPCRIPIAALLSGSDAAVRQRAEEIANEPLTTCKLKVGRHTEWKDDVQRVLDVRTRLRDDQNLRLDANRAWNWETAICFAAALYGVAVQFVEEPLREPERLEEFFEHTRFPYALDESLADGCDPSRFPNAAAFVLKPTKLGSTVVQQLLQLGRPVVWSACYESGIGIARIAQWAARSCPDVPAGLDTYAALEEDLLATPLAIEAGQLIVPANVELLPSRLSPIEIS